MIFKHCPNCEKKTGYKRAFGAGTVIGFFFTLGLWLLVMPFYPLRCTICGMDIDQYEDRSRQRSREKLGKPGERANPIKLRK